MKRVAAVLATLATAVALTGVPSVSSAQQATRSGVSQQSAGDVQTELEKAKADGWNAGFSRNTTGQMISSGAYSLLIPGLGFTSLLAGSPEIPPTLAEQASIEGKDPAYKQAYLRSYSEGANKKRRSAIVTGSAVGSVVSLMLYASIR